MKTHKRCPGCEQSKHVNDFYKNAGEPYRLCFKCRGLLRAPRVPRVPRVPREVFGSQYCYKGVARDDISGYYRHLRDVGSVGYTKQLLSGGNKTIRRFVEPELVLEYRENLLLKRELRKLNQTIKEIQK